MVKNLPAMQETWIQSLGQEDPQEKGMAIHTPVFLPKELHEQRAWRFTVHGVTKNQTRLTNTSLLSILGFIGHTISVTATQLYLEA